MPKEESLSTLKELIEEASRIFLDSSRMSESKSLWKKALRMARKEENGLEEEYVKGKMSLVDRKWEEALKHFNEAINMNSDFCEAWSGKAYALANLGRHEKAMICYDKALEINPKFTEAWDLKGILLEELKRYEEAVECYNKALETNPDFEVVWCNKGNSLNRIGKYTEAMECYDEALRINPEFAAAWANKGVSLSKMNWYKEAIECYDRALGLNPGYEFAQYNRDLALLRLEEYDEAKKEMERLYSKEKKMIRKSKIPEREKRGKILEIDAKREIINELGKSKYEEILRAKREYEEKLAASLKPRNKSLDNDFFLVLRRWNSYTPMMHTTTESNLGGGYFLYWKGKGIVIDPGFDFIDNFFDNDLVIYDINAIIITHAHVDHCNDFESLITLIFEYNEKNKEKKKIDLFMNLGALKKFLGWVPLSEDTKTARIGRIYPLERGISYNLKDYNLKLSATKAIHNEVLSKDYSVGLMFELYDKGIFTVDNPFKIGYTSDTRHDEEVEEQYEGVDIIIPHLGSIDQSDFNLEEETRSEDHLMLKGVISTIHKSDANLAIISEFGEELGEHRMTIVGALSRIFEKNKMARCLTGDIGLNISIPALKVKCHYCNKYRSYKGIYEGLDPENEGRKRVIYYCKKCGNIYKHEEKKATERKRKLNEALSS
jgi:tetratricopeptide (TPR) repeat protein/ribonuclease BN (tRNA processing enzyme)